MFGPLPSLPPKTRVSEEDVMNWRIKERRKTKMGKDARRKVKRRERKKEGKKKIYQWGINKGT